MCRDSPDDCAIGSCHQLARRDVGSLVAVNIAIDSKGSGLKHHPIGSARTCDDSGAVPSAIPFVKTPSPRDPSSRAAHVPSEGEGLHLKDMIVLLDGP